MNLSFYRPTTSSLALLAAFAFAGTAHAKDIQRSFSVQPGESVVVDVERAEINVTSWDQPEVEFSAKDAENHVFEFSQKDGVVAIRGSYENWGGWFNWFSSSSQAEINMKVPYRQDLNLVTRGGDIELDRLQGEFSARTSGGDIDAEEVDGPVDAKTSGGNIEVEKASGSVDAATSGGSIQLDAVGGEVSAKTSGGRIHIGEAGGAVVATTSGGSIEVESAEEAVQARTSGGSVEVGFVAQPDGDSELRTSGGNVTVYLPDGFKADVSASAFGGGVSSDFSEVSQENSAGRESLQLTLNGGGPEMVLKTSGGSVRIRRIED